MKKHVIKLLMIFSLALGYFSVSDAMQVPTEAYATYEIIETKNIKDIKTTLDIPSSHKSIVYVHDVKHKKKPVKKVKKNKTIWQKAGEKYNIDPYLLEAIERLECGNYTSDLYIYHYNTWGARCYCGAGHGWEHFSSREESTMELARCLRTYYFDQGVTTIEGIGQYYCPGSDSWAPKVRQIYGEVKARHEKTK